MQLPRSRPPVPLAGSGRNRVPKRSCKDQFSLVEPQINAEGIHVWPFEASCPVDVVFMHENGRDKVRMNRHSYFEMIYLCSGNASFHIQDRVLPFREGDLAIVGSTLYHRVECDSSMPATVAAMFFEPDFIRCDGGSDSSEYLAPFHLQDAAFPHIIASTSGLPKQVFDLMLRLRTVLPAKDARGKLTTRTYLKMILMLLVNHYDSYAGTVETFQRQQKDLDRLMPLFKFLGANCGNDIQVRKAARLCAMSESHFMSFFKRTTGLSFMKYLNQFRVERSQMLLLNTDESIASIGQNSGFCDQSYFGTVFRKLVGLTPAEYRRRFRRQRNSEVGHLEHVLQPAPNGNERKPIAAIHGYATEPLRLLHEITAPDKCTNTTARLPRRA
jgi:AraC-like DNA-binding protein